MSESGRLRLPELARRHRRHLIWGALLVALTAWLAFLPLFDVVGFEFAFVLGIVAGFASADLGAAWVRRARREGGSSGRPVRALAALVGRAVGANLLLLALPLALMSLNALRVRNCDFLLGLGVALALPGFAVLFGTTTGVVSGLVLARRPRLAIAAAWLFVVASIAVGIWRFYAAPAIFGYDPYAGYFPGTLYDENITLAAPFWWSRVYHLCVASAALALCAALLDPKELRLRAALPKGRVPTALAALLAAGAAVFLYARSGDLGFHVDAADVAAHLRGRRETAHFVIHYPRGASFEPQMDAIAADHELRWAQLARVFGAAPPGKITCFYFATAGDKARWMGARNTYVAKPWRHEIYIQHEEFPHDTLKHEIAHVFAGEFGDPLFQVSVKWWGWPPASFNVGLIEGAAVAADWPGGGRLTTHQSVKAMKELGFLPPLRSVLATGFFQFSAARSYTTAGSFVKFLLDRYGADKFRSLYRSGGAPSDFDVIYGKSLAAIESEWHAEIDAQPLSDEDREIAADRYRRRGIFQRPCPHAIARRAALAGEKQDQGDAPAAAALWRRICTDDPGEPSHRLALAGALEQAGDVTGAAGVYREVAAGDQPAPLRARALLMLVDLLGRAGDQAEALAAAERALALPIDDTTRRNLIMRRVALLGGSPGLEALRRYFFSRGPAGSDPDPVVLMSEAHAIQADPKTAGAGAYLIGRLLWQRNRWPEATAAFLRSAELGVDEPLVARERDRLLAASAFLSGDLAAARAAATRLAAPDQPPAIRLEGDDWLSRIRFTETGTP